MVREVDRYGYDQPGNMISSMEVGRGVHDETVPGAREGSFCHLHHLQNGEDPRLYWWGEFVVQCPDSRVMRQVLDFRDFVYVRYESREKRGSFKRL